MKYLPYVQPFFARNVMRSTETALDGITARMDKLCDAWLWLGSTRYAPLVVLKVTDVYSYSASFSSVWKNKPVEARLLAGGLHSARNSYILPEYRIV